MLLAIDVGNTSMSVGVFDGDVLKSVFSTVTKKSLKLNEVYSELDGFFTQMGVDPKSINSSIISCVVPEIQNEVCDAVEQISNSKPILVSSSIKTNMPIIYDDPGEVGADRIVNSVAAYNRFKSSVVIVDFGTATTFDCVSEKGEYLGGAIAPGILISTEALTERASKLPAIEITKPENVIGKNTVESMKSGIVNGYISLVDGLIEKIKDSMGTAPRVIATGGLSRLIAEESKYIEFTDENLTLEGLKILMELNG